jgi:hypothetical protein
MSDGNNNTEAVSREGSPTAQLADAAAAEQTIADSIEAAIGTPASIEEEQMLEAAELLEVELAGD